MKLDKELVGAIVDGIGGAIVLLAIVAFWIFCTPDQMSAEYDLAAAESEAFEATHPQTADAVADALED